MRVFILLAIFLLVTSINAADPPRKNVLLLIADDLGMEVGCCGDKAAKTPNIDAFAKTGTRFTHGFASVSSCSPSRAAILSGLPTHQSGQYGLAHDVHDFYTFRNVPSVPRLLKAAGYRTGVIAKLHVQPAEVYPWDVEVKNNGRNGAVIATEAKKFFDESGDKPFFLLVGFTDPHRAKRGFDSQAPLKGMPTVTFDPKALSLPYFLPDQPDARADYADYYGSVARLDFGVGAVLQALKDTKRDADTLVIFLSDNGIPFPGAKTTLYDPGLNLPLVIHAPGAKASVNKAMVSWTDIAPTILDWAGVKPAPAMGGKSLLPLLGQDDAKDRDVVFGSHQFHEITMYYPMRMVRTRTHKLIVNLAYQLPVPTAADLFNSDTWQGILQRKDTMVGKRSREALEHRPREEFFDLTNDPNELTNLAGDPAYGEVLKELRTKLRNWQVATKDPWLVKETHE
ncbi:MAG TPA: sulfatase [Gemmataceae bacterium]|jgi:N-sulfoglucosamine sulfohydrolase|nr:sulfatase [Gemmataceae bacterium]